MTKIKLVKASEIDSITHSVLCGLRDLMNEPIDAIDRFMLNNIAELARRLGVKANLYGRGGVESTVLNAVRSINSVITTHNSELVNVALVNDKGEPVDVPQTLSLIAEKATNKALQLQNYKASI